MEELNFETVDLNPLFEASRTGNKRPLFTTLGKLPDLYHPDSYIFAAREFFKKSQSITFFGDIDHFMFVNWYEKNSLDDKYRREYALALRGIGLYPHEQQERFDFWTLLKDDILFIKPHSNFYPKVLPLSTFELLKCIVLLENPNRKWRQNLIRLSVITSLFWQSKRLNMYPKPLALDYIGQHIKIKDRGRISVDISLLEKYEIAKCIFKGGEINGKNGNTKKPNIYITNLPNHHQHKYPLIYVAPPLIKCGRDTEYLFDDLLVAMYGKRRSIVFLADSRQRRSHKPKKIHGKKWRHPWPIYEDMGNRIDQKLEIMAKELAILPVDTDYLMKSIDYYERLLNMVDESNPNLKLKIEAELRLCREMLKAKQIPHDFQTYPCRSAENE